MFGPDFRSCYTLPTGCPVRSPTLRNQIQDITISVQFVPGTRFLVFDFGVQDPSLPGREEGRLSRDALRPGSSIR
eukprot:2701252-Rhodomonas_salina.1